MLELFTEKITFCTTRSNVHIDIKYHKVHCSKKTNFRTPKQKNHYGLGMIKWMGPSHWNLVPEDMKKAKTVDLLKKEVKCLTFENCPCKVCKEYMKGI